MPDTDVEFGLRFDILLEVGYAAHNHYSQVKGLD